MQTGQPQTESHFKKISSTFKKRSGTTNYGKDYEHLFLASTLLRLITDDTVEDFYVSSNHKDYGGFDDAVFEIKHHDTDAVETFAFQLKHKNKSIKIIQLESKEGDFSINEYFKDFSKLSTKSVKCILFTNADLHISKTNIDLTSEELKTRVKLEETTPHKFFTLNNQCYKFRPEDKYKTDFDKFYLYSGQPNAENLRKDCLRHFQRLFSCDEAIFNEYLNFIYNWSMSKGKKEKLNKSWVKRAILLRVLSPFIKPLNFTSTQHNPKIETLKNAINNFKITIIKNKSYDIIKTIWQKLKDNIDITEMNKIRTKYLVDSNESLDELKLSKLFWLMEECPLIVEGCPEVFKAINLSDQEKFIILDPQFDLKDYVCFKHLSDLKNGPIYKQIVSNFSYSLEGQKGSVLENIINDGDIENLITSDQLLQMIDGPLPLGEIKEVLPPNHIRRTLSRVIIDTQYLTEFNEDTLIIIENVKDVNRLSKFCNECNIIVYTSQEENDQLGKTIYVCENSCSQQQFDILSSKRINCHLFRIVSNEFLEWIRSKNGIEELRKFEVKSNWNLNESDFFNYPNNNLINIICENAGMGKTTLMKSLKLNSSSSHWTIVVYARYYGLHFRTNGSDVEKFLEYVVENNCQDYQKVFKSLIEKNCLEIIWDGLDELTVKTFTTVLAVIHKFYKMGIRQWITARNNLQEALEKEFDVFSRTIRQFDEEEQKMYIKNRLKLDSAKELMIIYGKIKTNLQLFPNNNILGIPLQVYMLTELLIDDKEKYLNLLQEIFTVADLYQHFVEKIFHDNYKEKRDYNINIDINFEEFENTKAITIGYYKKIALCLHLENDFYKFDSCTLNDCRSYLLKIKDNKDAIGFIIHVSEDNSPQFLHNSYGEYFAALFLSENFTEILQNTNFVANAKYENIRFFLDVILSKGRKAHIAILYKNSQLLEQCTEDEINTEDTIGRGALEMSCLWNKKFQIIETRKGENHYLINNTQMYELMHKEDEIFERTEFKTFLPKFKNAELELKKIMLLLPFIIQFCQSNVRVDEKLIPTILYHSVKYDYGLVFSLLSPIPFVKITNLESLLDVAIESNAVNCLKYIILNKQYKSLVQNNVKTSYKICLAKSTEVLNVFTDNGWNINQLHQDDGMAVLHYICDFGDFLIFNFLLENGANVNQTDNNGKLPIHYACKNERYDIVEALIQKGSKVDVPDDDGKCTIHFACESAQFNSDLINLLIQKGENLNVLDHRNKTPLHYACEKKSLDVVKLLVSKGAQINNFDIDHKAPIYYACTRSDGFEITEFLIKKGAQINTSDKNGMTLIHYTCAKSLKDITGLLIKNGASMIVIDKDGKLPIHHACKNEDILQLLIQSGVDINTPDQNGKLPLYYACENQQVNALILLIQNEVKITPDGENRMPIHFACEKGWLNAVKLLIQQNDASVNFSDNFGKTPLHYACQKKHTNIVNLLIENSAKVNACDLDGQLPIHYACSDVNSYEIVKTLFRNGAKLDAVSGKGEKPIHLASRTSTVKVLKFLVLNGESVNVPDANGRLPIHHGCRNAVDAYEVVKFLIQRGAKIDAPDREGKLPIHYGCKNLEYGDELVKCLIQNGAKFEPSLFSDVCKNFNFGYDIVKMFVQKGTDVNRVDDAGKTLIEYACLNERTNILKLLIDRGANVNANVGNGKTLVHYFCEKDRVDIVELLVQKGAIVNVADHEGKKPIDYVPYYSSSYKKFEKILQVN